MLSCRWQAVLPSMTLVRCWVPWPAAAPEFWRLSFTLDAPASPIPAGSGSPQGQPLGSKSFLFLKNNPNHSRVPAAS